MDAELVAWGARVRSCDDGQLMVELQQLVRRDRRCEVRMLMYLAEVDERRLFLEQGYSCLYRYTTAVLRMSDQRAYLRIQAARLARRFPVVIEMLAEGALSLSTLKLLDQYLTDDNHSALLERARNKTKDEVALLVAEIAPKPDVPNHIRKLPAKSKRRPLVTEAKSTPLLAAMESTAPLHNDAERTSESNVWASDESDGAMEADAEPSKVETSAAAAFRLEAPRASCTPLRPGRFKLQLAASQELRDKLMQLQAWLRHQVPGGDLAEIVERACDLLLEKTLKQRCAQVSRSRSSGAKDPGPQRADAEVERVFPSGPDDVKGSRYIPRAVLREVSTRDGGQCTYVGPSGHRCDERGMLEVHHIIAFARGGKPTVENLQLVCRSHNNFFAVQDFGAAHIKRASRKSKAIKSACSPAKPSAHGNSVGPSSDLYRQAR